MQKVNIDIKSHEAKRHLPHCKMWKTANRRALKSHGLDCGAFGRDLRMHGLMHLISRSEHCGALEMILTFLWKVQLPPPSRQP
jgi:hypothetical protein